MSPSTRLKRQIRPLAAPGVLVLAATLSACISTGDVSELELSADDGEYQVAGGGELPLGLPAGETELTVTRLGEGSDPFRVRLQDEDETTLVDLSSDDSGQATFSSEEGAHTLTVEGDGDFDVSVATRDPGRGVKTMNGEGRTRHVVPAAAPSRLEVGPLSGRLELTIERPGTSWRATVEIDEPIEVDLPSAGTYEVTLSGRDLEYEIYHRPHGAQGGGDAEPGQGLATDDGSRRPRGSRADRTGPPSAVDERPSPPTLAGSGGGPARTDGHVTTAAAPTVSSTSEVGGVGEVGGRGASTSSTVRSESTPTAGSEGDGDGDRSGSTVASRPEPKPAPSTTPAESVPPRSAGERPAYARGATVNRPIPDGVATHPRSDDWLEAVVGASDGGRLTSDVTQNSYTVYHVDSSTPTRSVKLDNGYFSRYVGFEATADGVRIGYGYEPTIVDVPVPSAVSSGGGSDGQILFLNAETGEEWSFWQWDSDNDGTPDPVNGYVYDYRNGSGRTLRGGRGAGVAKLYGLVLAEEANSGSIDHAIAVAFPGDTLSDDEFVYPATKSDGQGGNGNLPEGARLQLDRTLTDADFARMGLGPEARAIARAMQRYGLIVVDRSGRNKVFLESSITGEWALDDDELEYLLDPLVNDGTTVDWTRHFRVVDFDRWTGGATGIQAD